MSPKEYIKKHYKSFLLFITACAICLSLGMNMVILPWYDKQYGVKPKEIKPLGTEVTYYFNSHTEMGWPTNPDYMSDGNIATFAETSGPDVEQLVYTNCDGTDLGTITKVELRVYGYYYLGDKVGSIQLMPFSTPYEVELPATAGWTSYADITSEIDPWLWKYLPNLGCMVTAEIFGDGQILYVAKVEIRVTYTVAGGAWHSINEWNGSLYTSPSWKSVAEWNGSLYTSPTWHSINEWNGSLYVSPTYHNINDWNGSLYVSSAWKSVAEWNGSLYTIPSWHTTSDWNGSLYTSSSWSSINDWNGSLYTTATWNTIADWNGSLYTTSSWHTTSEWNGSLYYSTTWSNVNEWNGSLYTSSTWKTTADWNGSLYTSSSWHTTNDWNGSLYYSTTWSNVNEWNGSLYTSPSWISVAEWNGSLYTSSTWQTTNEWNGSLYYSSTWNTVANWNGSLYVVYNWNTATEWNGSLYTIPEVVPPATPYNLNLLVINPNPGNGTHSTNYLKRNSSGLTTSIDVFYENFTSPPTSPPSSGTITIIGTSMSKVCLYNSSTNYTNVWANTTGNPVATDTFVGQYKSGSTYVIYRSMLLFDTSVLPDDAVIDNGKLVLIGIYDGSTSDFNVTIQETKPPLFHNPLVPGDYWKNGYAGNFGYLNTTLFAEDDYFNITLNAGGLASISLTGNTKWALRSDQDINHSAPPNSEIVAFYAYSYAPYYPRIIIGYHTPNPDWKHLVNLTWYSNSSGAWIQYYKSYVNSNGTVTVPAINFSGIDTYYWYTSWESNGTNIGNSQVFNFETVKTGMIMINTKDHFLFGLEIGGLLFFILGIVLLKKRKSSNKTK
jgi:hypothetical protein